MKLTIIRLFIFFAVFMVAGNATALDDLIDSVEKGCQKELNSYCKKVTPGEGRLLACLYAYNDKLSGKCEYALYDAAAQLEHAIAQLTYVANECKKDLDKHCTGVLIGEGRLLACLEDNKKNVSKRCKEAVKEIDKKLKKFIVED